MGEVVRMSVPSILVMVIFLGISSLSAETAFQEKIKGDFTPLQISIYPPVIAPVNDERVTGLRVNILYGRIKNFTGYDMGLVQEVTEETVGVQEALISNISNDMIGIQIATFYNKVENIQGVQVGIVNDTGFINGFQFGLVNIAEEAHGIQFGLLNIRKNSIMPFINW